MSRCRRSFTLAFGWRPEIRGIVVVLIAVGVLMGSVYLCCAPTSAPASGSSSRWPRCFGWLAIMASSGGLRHRPEGQRPVVEADGGDRRRRPLDRRPDRPTVTTKRAPRANRPTAGTQAGPTDDPEPRPGGRRRRDDDPQNQSQGLHQAGDYVRHRRVRQGRRHATRSRRLRLLRLGTSPTTPLVRCNRVKHADTEPGKATADAGRRRQPAGRASCSWSATSATGADPPA